MRRVCPRSSHTVLRDRLAETAVVTDHDQGGTAAGRLALKPFDGGQVQMVGGLVERQDVGSGGKHARQCRPPRLAAREPGRLLAPSSPSARRWRARWRSSPGQSGLHVSERRRRAGEIRLLRQIADGRAGLHEARAAVGRDQAGGDLEQVDLPDPLRPTRQTRSVAETLNSTPAKSGVPPKVNAMSLSWTSGGPFSTLLAGALQAPDRLIERGQECRAIARSERPRPARHLAGRTEVVIRLRTAGSCRCPAR